MTIGDKIQARLDKAVYRAAQERRDEIDTQAVADELVALHQQAFDTGVLTDAELSRAAELFETLHGAGAVREFDETWDILTQAAIARIQVADLDAARANYNGCTAEGRDYCTPHELREADCRLRVAGLARDLLKELGRKYPLLVGLNQQVTASI